MIARGIYLEPCADDCPICAHPRLKLAADRAIVLAADAKREAHAARVRKRLAAAGIVVEEGRDGSLWITPGAKVAT